MTSTKVTREQYDWASNFINKELPTLKGKIASFEEKINEYETKIKEYQRLKEEAQIKLDAYKQKIKEEFSRDSLKKSKGIIRQWKEQQNDEGKILEKYEYAAGNVFHI
tara:strand:- start:1241 stop:1564 length:324 start_codon:yes stop_codon:yes gene_type:complete